MPQTVRVKIFDRDYALRVDKEEDARLMHEAAAYVEEKMQSFRQAHPDRPELTTAVIASLAIAEDLFAEKHRTSPSFELESELDELATDLRVVLDAK